MRAKPFRSQRKPSRGNAMLVARLKALMAEQDLTAKALAETAGLNYTAVYDIILERAKQPKLDTMIALALALDVSVAYLAGLSDKR